MGSDEVPRKILKLLANGKLSVDEAVELLDAARERRVVHNFGDESANRVRATSFKQNSAKSGPAALEEVVEESGSGPQWLHVRVDDLKSGERKVTVNIPLRLLKLGVKLGYGFAPGLNKVNWREVGSAIVAGTGHMLVDVMNEDDGERVQIYLD